MDKALSRRGEEQQKINFAVHTKQASVESRALEIVEYYKEHKPYTFGQALCQCMRITKVTVETLSARTGFPVRKIGRLRNDETEDIEFGTIIALCVALNLAPKTAESLLSLKRYTLNCDEPYTQICRMFLEEKNVSDEACNKILKSFGFEPLTNGEILAA